MVDLFEYYRAAVVFDYRYYDPHSNNSAAAAAAAAAETSSRLTGPTLLHADLINYLLVGTSTFT